ncbi:hypothetical protein D770_03540 [Flammeovirgaceae bacterium 311]|nr:hypothetical protein D770_03540 [Flammeovirgaceae bacterium 311]
MIKKRFYLCLFVLISLLSCGKDELTSPVTAELLMELDVNNDQQNELPLQVTGASLLLKEVVFDGYRESGENYFFTKDFPDSLKVSFSKDKAGRVMQFEMPQGIYSRIEIKMGLPAGREANLGGDIKNRAAVVGGVEIWGDYKNVHGVKVPFLFVYTSVDEFRYTAKTVAGNQQVVVKDNGTRQARLKFDAQQWMDLINPRMLQSAKPSLVNGVPTLVISKKQNDHIYNLLANRIERSANLFFE